MARMSAPGSHNHKGLIGRAKQLLRRKDHTPPPTSAPARKPGIDRSKLDAYLAAARAVHGPKVKHRAYPGATPGSCSVERAARRDDRVSRRQHWSLTLPLEMGDAPVDHYGIGVYAISGTMTTFSRSRRPLMKLARKHGVLPVLVAA